MTMRRRIALAVAAPSPCCWGACSTPATRVVLLGADGRPSAVVRAKGGEQRLDKPYQRATAAVGATGAPVVDAADRPGPQGTTPPCST